MTDISPAVLLQIFEKVTYTKLLHFYSNKKQFGFSSEHSIFMAYLEILQNHLAEFPIGVL